MVLVMCVCACEVTFSVQPYELYSLPNSSVHVILQARILKWVAISFSRGSSWPWNRVQISCIAGRFFTDWAMKYLIYLVIYQDSHL